MKESLLFVLIYSISHVTSLVSLLFLDIDHMHVSVKYFNCYEIIWILVSVLFYLIEFNEPAGRLQPLCT